MQVKKFEAKTIQEAIELVKTTLGPDAVILSAKDNSKRFGIGGETSIEVTAAISEEMVHKKRLAEMKLNEQDKQRFLKAPARVQKEFISKAIDKSLKDYQQKRQRFTEIPYIDIVDEEEAVTSSPPATSISYGASTANHSQENNMRARSNIKNAAQKALETIKKNGMMSVPPSASLAQIKVSPTKNIAPVGVEESELHSLRKEVEVLREIISQFNKVPQNFLSLHPGAQEGVSYELSFMYERLLQSGITRENVLEILKQAQSQIPEDKIKKKPFVDAWVARYFLNTLKVSENRDQGLFHFFVGPNSQGKTSALVKFATELVVIKKRKVVILSTDHVKVGASDQLKIFSQILNVPFATVTSAQDWTTLKDSLHHFDHVLVDFPGLNLKNLSELEFLKSHIQAVHSARLHYVQSLLVGEKEALSIASRYKSIGVHDVIYTKLDELSQFGLIYNFQKEFHWPVHSYSIGPKIPEDFEEGTKERFIDLVFKLSQVQQRSVS